MDSVIAQREARRKRAVYSQSVFVLALFVALAVGSGIVAALVLAAALVLLFCALPCVLRLRADRAELRRRELGADPSWAANLPVSHLRMLGGETRYGAKPTAAVQGRLSLTRQVWLFTPSPFAARNGATTSVSWSRELSLRVAPLWGAGDLGVATFTMPSGAVLGIEVRHPADLTGGPEPVRRERPATPARTRRKNNGAVGQHRPTAHYRGS